MLHDLLGDRRGRILDVGCGPGKIALALVDHVKRVDAIDFSRGNDSGGKVTPQR